MAFIMTNDGKLAADVSRMDNVVDRLTEAIKRYVRQVDTRVPDKPEGPRAMEIVSFASNLEHFGNIIDKNLCELAVKKRAHVGPRYRVRYDGRTSYSACIPHDA